MVTLQGIPVYNAIIPDESAGMLRISLVDAPAVLSNFQAFAEQTKRQLYTVADDDAQIVRGCVMRADFPIYRRDEMGEYYIVYKAEEIRKMAEKYLTEGRQNLVDLMHSGEDINGVQMVQYFIKGNGVTVDGFDDIADGSLFAEFHITDPAIWAEIKTGTYKGFSLEGVFALEPETDETARDIYDELQGLFRRIANNKTMSKLSKIMAEVTKRIANVEFASTSTDKGVIFSEGEIEIGADVFGLDENGERVALEDGEYIRENDVIVVAGGKITEIREIEAPAEESTEESGDEGEHPAPVEGEEEQPEASEEAPAPETEEQPEEQPEEVAEEVAEESDEQPADDIRAELDAIRGEIAAVREAIDAINAELEALKASPVAQSASETFKARAKANDDKLARAMEIAKGMRR